MGLRQRKRVEPVRCVSVGRPAVERQMSAESESVRGSGLYQVTEIRRSGCGPHLVGQQEANSSKSTEQTLHIHLHIEHSARGLGHSPSGAEFSSPGAVGCTIQPQYMFLSMLKHC